MLGKKYQQHDHNFCHTPSFDPDSSNILDLVIQYNLKLKMHRYGNSGLKLTPVFNLIISQATNLF